MNEGGRSNSPARVSYATTWGRCIARAGTEQLSKRYFQDRVPLVSQTKYAVVRAGCSPSRLALSFGPASRDHRRSTPEPRGPTTANTQQRRMAMATLIASQLTRRLIIGS